MPNWDRKSLVESCLEVCETFAVLHESQILVGDVNPRNLLVSKSDPRKVYFVDCDSYQVGEFTCPVGMVEYSSPEVLERIDRQQGSYANCIRTIKDEQFSMAVLLFKMLMSGISPFAAKSADNISAGIRNRTFAFKSEENKGYDAPDGPYKLIWSNTPKTIKDMFANTFTGKTTYSAKQWKYSFEAYLRYIDQGVFTRELLPKKYYDPTGDRFRDFECAECKQVSNMPIEKLELRKNQPLFCNQCWSALLRAKTISVEIACNGCGKAYTVTKFDQLMQEHGNKWYCNSCLRPILTCDICYQTFEGKRSTLEKKRNGEIRRIRCPKCLEEYKRWRDSQ